MQVADFGDTLVATSGKVLFKAPFTGEGTETNPVLYTASGGKIGPQSEHEEKLGKYPNWQQVVPKDLPTIHSGLDTGRLWQVLKQASAVFKDTNFTVKNGKGQTEDQTPYVLISINPDGSLAVRGEAENETQNGKSTSSNIDTYEHNVQPGSVAVGRFDADLLMPVLAGFRALGQEKVAIQADGDTSQGPVMFVSPVADVVVMRVKGPPPSERNAITPDPAPAAVPQDESATPEDPNPAQEPEPTVGTPAPAARKPRAPKKPKLNDLLAAYFTPGKVVKSYGGFDRVISLDTSNPDQWNVTVQAVKQTGGGKLNTTTATQEQINAASWEDESGSQPRTHHTLPSQKDLDAAWKAKQETLGQPPSTDVTAENVMSKSRVEDMLKRAWNANMKDYFDDGDPNDPHTWQEWVKLYEPHQVALVLDSDYEINQRFLADLPEDVMAQDIIEAYKGGKITNDASQGRKVSGKMELEELPFESTGEIGEPPVKEPLPPATLQTIFNTAKMRATKANTPAIMAARKTFLIQAHIQDASAALEISQKDINKALRSWSNYSADARETAERLNRGVPNVSEWTGIQNSAFISRTTVSPSDVDAMVHTVEAPDKSWNTPDAKSLRNYIVRTFLAIDTRINYSDLSFLVESTIKPRGLYQSSYRTITMRENSPNTLAHEVGHYLDHKWGLEAGVDTLLSDSSISLPIVAERISPERAEWVKKFREWVMDISERADIRSGYTQSRREAFARFVDSFVAWTAKTAGVREWQRGSDYSDRFHEGDFAGFVRLLQEKAFVDAKDGNPNGSSKNAYTPPPRPSGDVSGVADDPLGAPPTRAAIGQTIRSFEQAWKPFFTYSDDTAPKEKRKAALRKIIDQFATPENNDLWKQFAELPTEGLVPEDAERVAEAKELLPYLENLTLGQPPNAKKDLSKWSKSDKLSNDFLGTSGWKSFRDGIKNIDPAAKNGNSSKPTSASTKDAELASLWRSGFTAVPNSKEDTRGGEHTVEFRDSRAYKQTHPETFGAKFSPETPDSLIWGTPLEYLQRWRLFNEVFDGADVRFEGVVMHPNGALSLKISQPLFSDAKPSAEQVTSTLKDAGWRNIALNTWEKNTSRGTMRMTDAKPENFAVQSGVVVPVDVILSIEPENQTLGQPPSGYRSPADMLAATQAQMQGKEGEKPAGLNSMFNYPPSSEGGPVEVRLHAIRLPS